MLFRSFQTYTIPRYALPLEPIFLTALAASIYRITKVAKYSKYFIYALLISVAFVRIFWSIDPVSTHIWSKTAILGQSFYALNGPPSLSGFDGITYNFQYNLAVARRSNIILSKYPDKNNCAWIFPDPNNDRKTIEILKLKNINPGFVCF